MVLGLGVSHQPVNATLGVEMGSPLAALRHYVTEERGSIGGLSLKTSWNLKPSQPIAADAGLCAVLDRCRLPRVD